MSGTVHDIHALVASKKNTEQNWKQINGFKTTEY